MSVLVVDIGGTRLRTALARWRPIRLEQMQVTATADIASLADWLEDYLAFTGAPRPAACAIAVAGPVDGDRVRLSNIDLALDAAALGARLKMPVHLYNDFTAVAWSLPVLTDDDRRPLGGGNGRPGSAMAVLGPGTGFGVSGLLPAGGGWAALAGEGGHAALSVGTIREERAVFDRLAAGGRFVAAEDVLCGPGLCRLYGAIARKEGTPAAVEIAARAETGEDPAACAAVRLFARWLGRYAGDLALILGAHGGVYLAGGILPAWGELFDVGEFRLGFEDKGRFSDYVASIPYWLITHPQPGLLGLAAATGEA